MPEKKATRVARLQRNNAVMKKFSVNEVSFGDLKTRVERMKRKDKTWTITKAINLAIKLFIKHYKK